MPKYLDQEQYEQMEILLGTLLKSKNDLLYYLSVQDINAGCHTKKGYLSFNSLIKESADLDNLFHKTLELTIKWCNESLKLLKKTPTKELMDGIAGRINITRKDYSDDRIKFNIKQFLQNNISIPRGFIINLPFFKADKDASNISKRINDLVPDESLGEFYLKIKDYKSDIRKYKEFGKEIDHLKTLDKMLLLMAGDYLEQKVIRESRALHFTIANDIREVFKGEISFDRHNKSLVFGIKEFDKISTVLEDRRLENILKYYFPDNEKKIYFLNREKYEERRQAEEEESTETVTCNNKVFDIQDALQKVECEQLHIVDSVMKLEKTILTAYVSKKLPEERGDFLQKALDDYARVRLPDEKSERLYKKKKSELWKSLKEAIKKLVKDGNRIETKTLLKIADLESEVEIIKKNRNAAFHNDIPDGGFQLKQIMGICK